MKTIKNIKKVALLFFIATGILHLGSTALIINNMFLKEAFIVNRVMDIPFIITGIIYGFASIRLTVEKPEDSHKIMNMGFIGITVLMLAGLLFINLFLPTLK